MTPLKTTDLLPMEKDVKITVLAGPYGSGKTEIAINRSFAAGMGQRAAIADLDIVNPYFRSRELREEFEKRGIEVLAPRGSMAHADLPALTGDLNRAAADPTISRLVVDVGGDPAGARLLGMYKANLNAAGARLFLVVNPNRPFSSTPTEILEATKSIEAEAGMKAQALISNPHMMDHTTPETIIEGHDIVKAGAELAGIPVAGLFYVPEYLAGWNPDQFDCPLIPMERFMLPPWFSDMKRMAPYRDRRSLME